MTSANDTPQGSSARLPGLDTLRALAILLVMLFHFRDLLPERFDSVYRLGWMGVDLFFVLSGYLIGSQLLKPYRSGTKPSLRDFYRRRAFRILPAYLVVVCLYFIWPHWREADGISPLWQFLTFTENLLIDYSRNQAFSHAWSLCVEEHFYLVLPLLVLLLMRRPSFRKTITVLLFVAAAGMALRGYIFFHILRPLGHDNLFPAYFEDVYYPTYTRLDGLLVGVSIALLKMFRPVAWTHLARRGHSAVAIGCSLVATALWLMNHRTQSVSSIAAWGDVVGFPLLSLGLGLLAVSALSSNGWLSRFHVPGAKLLATLAFSLYLTHKEIAHLDQLYLPSLMKGRGMEAVLMIAVTCLAAGALLYLCIERPFMQLRDQLDHIHIREADAQVMNEPAL